MEHFIRIAFWIVSLSGCLQIESQPIREFPTEAMQAKVICLPDSKFYAPENVERECYTKALECILKELNGTVKQECKDPQDYIGKALEQLDQRIGDLRKKDNAPTSSTKCACELWPETPFSEFLNKTKSFLEKLKTEEKKNNWTVSSTR